jgi:hypothetical protein
MKEIVGSLFAWLFLLALTVFIGTFFQRVRTIFARRRLRYRQVRWTSLGVSILALIVVGAVTPADKTEGPNASSRQKPQPATVAATAAPQEPGNAAETLRAATLFCLGFKPLLQKDEKVNEAESLILPQPCTDSDGKPEYCANGFRIGPSDDIAKKFGISWEKANADIVAGLKRFDPKSHIDDACESLEKNDAADMAPVRAQRQRELDAWLALCIAADHEYADVVNGRGASEKDAIILANQFSVGQRAGGQMIGHEWLAYKDGKWHDSDCYVLSSAPWALNEGYAGDPIRLPEGAIAVVVNNHGWVPPVGSN